MSVFRKEWGLVRLSRGPTCGEALVYPTILILEDSSAMINTLDSILTSQGYQVDSCGDGESCWRHLLAGMDGRVPVPDLLLLDLNLPGLDGFGLLDRIRAEKRLARLPVIVLTTQADAETRTDALRAGATDCLSKPIELSELLNRLESALSGLAYGGSFVAGTNASLYRSRAIYGQKERGAVP